MALSVFPADSVERLPSGFPLQYEVKESIERGEKLCLYFWSVAVPVPPHGVRVAVFSHTILAKQKDDPQIKAEIEFLQHSIRSAAFSQTSGVAAADPKSDEPRTNNAMAPGLVKYPAPASAS